MNNLSGDFSGLIPEKKVKKSVVKKVVDQDLVTTSDESFRESVAKLQQSNEMLKLQILELYDKRKTPELYSAEVCTRQLKSLLDKISK